MNRKQRQRMFEMQGGKCWLCDTPMFMSVSENHPDFATFDHVTPKSQGGTDALCNLRLAHKRCNSLRGNLKDTRGLRRKMRAVSAEGSRNG